MMVTQAILRRLVRSSEINGQAEIDGPAGLEKLQKTWYFIDVKSMKLYKVFCLLPEFIMQSHISNRIPLQIFQGCREKPVFIIYFAFFITFWFLEDSKSKEPLIIIFTQKLFLHFEGMEYWIELIRMRLTLVDNGHLFFVANSVNGDSLLHLITTFLHIFTCCHQIKNSCFHFIGLFLIWYITLSTFCFLHLTV